MHSDVPLLPPLFGSDLNVVALPTAFPMPDYFHADYASLDQCRGGVDWHHVFERYTSAMMYH